MTARGYGVHSPLAYRWLRYVVHPSRRLLRESAYYDEQGLSRAARRAMRIKIAAQELGASYHLDPAKLDVKSCSRQVVHCKGRHVAPDAVTITDGRETVIIKIPGIPEAHYETTSFT